MSQKSYPLKPIPSTAWAVWRESKTHTEIDPEHTRIKTERFLMGQNRKKRANFQGSPLFQATYNIKTNNLLCLCQLDAGRLAEGKHAEMVDLHT